jgi:four helix bundle protein
MRNFQELLVWQRSHTLTLKVYALTKDFPTVETYGLISQMRRSASSIPTNIAEGAGRDSNAEMKRFLTIAAGSCSELEYQFILSKDIGYMRDTLYKELILELTEIRKMIYSFIKKLS